MQWSIFLLFFPPPPSSFSFKSRAVQLLWPWGKWPLQGLLVEPQSHVGTAYPIPLLQHAGIQMGFCLPAPCCTRCLLHMNLGLPSVPLAPSLPPGGRGGLGSLEAMAAVAVRAIGVGEKLQAPDGHIPTPCMQLWAAR